MTLVEPTQEAKNSIVARLADTICGFDKTSLTKKARVHQIPIALTSQQ